MLRKLTPSEIELFYITQYLPYIHELRRYGGGSGMTVSVMTNKVTSGYMDVFLYSEKGTDIAFMITEHIDCFYRPMLFLAEFCVDEAHRRLGVGKDMFRELLRITDVPIFFTVLGRNKAAMSFWRRMISVYDLRFTLPDERQPAFTGKGSSFCVERRRDIGAQGIDEKKKWPIERLALSTRSRNCLLRSRAYTVGDVLSLKPRDVERIRNFGKRSQDEVRTALSEFGLDVDW